MQLNLQQLPVSTGWSGETAADEGEDRGEWGCQHCESGEEGADLWLGDKQEDAHYQEDCDGGYTDALPGAGDLEFFLQGGHPGGIFPFRQGEHELPEAEAEEIQIFISGDENTPGNEPV